MAPRRDHRLHRPRRPLFLATFLLNSDEIATYGIAWRLGSLVTLPLVALSSVAPGRIFQDTSRHDVGGMRSMMAGPMRRAAGASLVFVAGLTIAGRPALRIFFGVEYVDAYVPMLIIAGGQLVTMWAGPVGHVLIGAKRERSLAVATTTSAAVLALLAPLGAIALHETGGALAMASSLVVGALIRNHMGQQAIGGRGVGSVWTFRRSVASPSGPAPT